MFQVESKSEVYGCNTAVILITDASADFMHEKYEILLGKKNVQ